MTGIVGDGPAMSCRRRHDLRAELLRRWELDQAARRALAAGREPLASVLRVDDDNARWLAETLDRFGWPGRRLVGEEGAHAAWLLAQHADRQPALQRRCLKLLEQAVVAGDAAPADLARLTDRDLLARGDWQTYGTQMAGRDGRYIVPRLRSAQTVDQRRASMGLGTLAAQLEEMLAVYGPPEPAAVLCPGCGAEIRVWLPEIGTSSSIECGSCRSVFDLRAQIPNPGAQRKPSD